MRSSSPGLDVLARAEAELRALIESALAGGRYDDVAELAQLADGLTALRTGAAAGQTGAPVHNGHRTQRRNPPPGTHVRANDGGGLPRFERDGNKLIKIAGKPGQGEYEHRAPFDVIETMLATIKAKRGVGARFTAPDVLPLTDPKTRREIPSYQSYLVLGWLRQEGVLIKHGREAYSLKPTAETAEHIHQLWNALPSRDQ